MKEPDNMEQMSTAALRDLIATEREQGRAFGPVAEQARTILAKRGEQS